MAERRMFAKTIIDSDAFLEMPQSTQNLYFHLGILAKDKGMVNNIFSICKTLGIGMKNIQVLSDNKYIQKVSEHSYFITHWYENNGIGETAKSRNNYKYREWRKLVLLRDGYKCQICGATQCKLNVHHISKWSIDILKRYDIDNGLTLCEQCHINLHKGDRVNG